MTFYNGIILPKNGKTFPIVRFLQRLQPQRLQPQRLQPQRLQQRQLQLLQFKGSKMTIDSQTKLETFDYGTPGWVHVYNKNIDLLNFVLLKINGLRDVDISNLENGSILTWDQTNQKWECVTY